MRVKGPRWAAAITGPEQDIAKLARHLSKPTRIYRGEEGWELTDDRWESIDQLADVYAEVQQITTHVRTLARLHIGAGQPIRFTGNIFERAGRSRHKHAIAAAERAVVRGRAFDATVAVTDSDGMAKPSATPKSWDAALELARRDAAVARALDFLSVEPNWHTLYAGLDPVRSDERTGKSDGVVRNGWATAAELERFTHTAQSYDAVGAEARHGRDIPTPMTLAEAEKLVGAIVAAWIDRLVQDGH